MTKEYNMYMTFLISLKLYTLCTLILLSKRSSGADYQYEACEPKNCGRGPNISFPFYISGRERSKCWYPGFSLNCNGNGFPVLALSENSYVIDDIFYENQSFHVYNAAALRPDSSGCLPRIRNTTLPDQFSYVNSRELYMFSSCRKPLPEALLRYNLSCESSGERNKTNNWDLALYGKDENLRKVMESCDRNVVAPVEAGYSGDDEDNIEILSVAEVLLRGFVLNWTASYGCSRCQNSGGRCGLNLLSTSNYQFQCFCTDGPHLFSCPYRPESWSPRKTLLFGGVMVTVLVPTFIFLFFIRRKLILLKLLILQKAMPDDEKDIESFLKSHGDLAPRRYRYSDLKRMTKSFNENLGRGGYGSVYKGKLSDGRLVAIKILNESKGNGEEFMNEVASISRTSHINIVTLIGFCFDGSKRALIYDFMPNGSLDKFIQNGTASTLGKQVGLGWRKMFEIAVAVGRGLEYLHRGCSMRIVHFDIKPHNILLDKDFNPKISDFGLAKLCPNRSSIVSMLAARGTIGYIAPEVFCRNFGEVSHKSDVYSFGMMVLEIAGGKKNIDPRDVDHSSEMYFPQYIYKQLESMDAENLDGINVDEDESQVSKRKLMIVGLWCIQTDPKHRPSMSKVVDMLEGKIEPLQVPPKPVLSSPPRSHSPPTSSISETM